MNRAFSPYEETLSRFCMSYRRFYQGLRGCSDMDQLKTMAQSLQKNKEQLLQMKERIGFTSGLKFLDTAYFADFKIIDGDVVGDLVKAYDWAGIYADRYFKGIEKSEIFLEVAFLIFALIPYPRYLRAKTA